MPAGARSPFKQIDLLRPPPTHTSGETRLAFNERLEFLGDAVLGLIVVGELYLRFPNIKKGI